MTRFTQHLVFVVIIVSLFTSCAHLQRKPVEPQVDQKTLQDITMSTIIFIETVKENRIAYESSYSDSTYEVSIQTSGSCFDNDFAVGGAIIIECADEFGNNDGIATTAEINDLFGAMPMMVEAANGITLPNFVIKHILNGDKTKAITVWNNLQSITKASGTILLP